MKITPLKVIKVEHNNQIKYFDESGDLLFDYTKYCLFEKWVYELMLGTCPEDSAIAREIYNNLNYLINQESLDGKGSKCANKEIIEWLEENGFDKNKKLKKEDLLALEV